MCTTSVYYEWDLPGVDKAYRGFTPLYLARANIACDVDENLRHDPDQRRDAEKVFFENV